MHRGVASGARYSRGFRSIAGEFGTGGRSSVSGLTVSIFGATGFLGRYVTNEFGKVGTTAYIANRGCEMDHRHLKPMFDLGMAGVYYYSPRDEDSIRKIIDGSDIVVNMIGKYHVTKHAVPTDENGRLKLVGGSRTNYDFQEVNVDIPAKLAAISKEMGCSQFVHVSALMADPQSKSEWARTKAAGEDAVLSAFPDATIIRPATLFGHEDRFMNWHAFMGERLPIVPVVEDGSALVTPVYVGDVADAIIKVIEARGAFSGARVDLAGPAEFTRKEIMEFIYDITKQQVTMVPVPAPFMRAAAYIADAIPQPYTTVDEVNLWLEDETLEPKEGTFTFEDLGIEPTPIDKIAFQYLHRFRKGGHFVDSAGYHDADGTPIVK